MAAEGVWPREKQMHAALHTAASWPEEGTVEGSLGHTGPREIQGFSLEEEEQQLGEGHKEAPSSTIAEGGVGGAHSSGQKHKVHASKRLGLDAPPTSATAVAMSQHALLILL